MKKSSTASFAFFASIAFFAFLQSCASSRLKVGKIAGGEIIEAEGSCPVVNGDVKGAKTCSLAEAQKQAVERVIGLYISAKIRVEKAVTIEQNILAKTEGYISQYDIIKEKQEGGFFKTKIRAMVLFDQIGNDLRGLDVLKMPAVGNPRIAVLITDIIGEEKGPAKMKEDDSNIVNHTSNGLSQVLSMRGYRLVDPEAIATAKAYEYTDEMLAGNEEALKNVGTKLKAEIIVYGEARVSPVTLEGVSLGGMKSYRATLSAKAARPQTGEVLHVLSAQASGLDATEDAALQKALEAAGRKAGDDLVRALSQKLLKEATVELTARVSEMGKVTEIRKTLSAMPGVDEIYLRSFGDNEAVLEIFLSKSGRTGVNDIADTLSEKLKAHVENLEGNTLTVTLR